ncbi:peptidoglycan-binding protein [Nisaea acidiphila]|uniref:Peptidoglycan-binding protein n=1 Tax=Nisaea acidiphila TaxID=1862145 RepID=A0A9J7ALD1_9PROT|nr:peptidoglycan-binding protein [Nisaea acidiphila]UUX47966.1 peptidoglycan-binding protein [Nisaea acidiphila]
MARKATTWSVKGIEEDVRDIARAAAERDDQTIGSWIDHAIRVHGGQRPRDESPDTAETGSPPERILAESQSSPTPPQADIGALLDIIDGELDASSHRLNTALRPMGLALLDLAERMVALERADPGPSASQARIAYEPDADESSDTTPEEEFDDDFGPEAPPDADIADLNALSAPIPQPPSRERDDEFPPEPLHDLDEGLDDLDMPMVAAESSGQSDRAREIDRRLRALAGVVDAVETDPPPPTGDLGPTEFDLEPPAEIPAAGAPDLPKAFRGVQQSGYESHPGEAAAETVRMPRRARRGRVRKVLLAASIILAVTAGGLYATADRIGLGPLRMEIDRRVQPAIELAAYEAAHFWESAGDILKPLRAQLEAILFGPETPDEMRKAGEPSEQARPEQPGPPSMPETVTPMPEAEPEQASSPAKDPVTTAEIPATEPATPASEPAPAETEPAPPEPQTAAEIAPEPAPSAPVPVPEAAPAETVTEVAPPAAPVLPPKPAEPATTATPSGGQIAALPPSGVPATGSGREELLQRAEAGDATAQHDLAILNLTGKGGPKDVVRAAELLREAAIQGLASAQYNLAVLYETGQGVRKDDVRALLWYHSAAEQGHPNAQYNLGVMYAEGRGIPLNFEEAARWFRAAANQGLGRALYNLAVMTDEGLGVTQDKTAALELYRAAAGAGDERAIELLAGSGDGGSEAGSPLSGAEGVQIVTATPASLVADIQAELARLEFYEGRLDGLMGPKTRAAIRAFQKSQSVSETGEASPELLRQLKGAAP